MANPVPDTPIDIPTVARDTVAAIVAAPTAPVKVLVSGGVGTGKSAVLATLRTALRSAGRTVLNRPPRADDPPDAALVIDDAHLLDDAGLSGIGERVADPRSTVVVATEAVRRPVALRTLATALERENPVLALGPLKPAEVRRAAATVGAAAPDLVASLMAATGGLPFLLRPAIAATSAADGRPPASVLARAAKVALLERLRRLDEPVLDALLVLSLSPELGADDLAAALRTSTDQAHALVDRAWASGLIDPSHSPAFVASVHSCIAQIAGAARHHDIEVGLLCSQLELSTLSSDLALQMSEHGLRDDRLATALTELATHSRGKPARAARLYRAAAEAGATATSAQLADALALSGDCTTAGRLADELLASDDPAERAAAVRIAASVAVHDGSTAQAADLFRWLGPYPDAFVGSAGTLVTVGAGDLDAARAALTVESAGPPTSTARAARSLAEGVLQSLDQPFDVAVARMGQAITGGQRSPAVAPDTPSAVVTLAALHAGDAVRARSVIARAVHADRDGGAGEGFITHRHRLLLGWVRMQDGQLTASAADASAAEAAADTGLHRRDALWAAALRTAIARRNGDSGTVQKSWHTAMEVLSEYSMDLFSLLPLGELWVAAARMRQVDRLQHPLGEAFALLGSLGNPVLWSVPLHWAGVHAGILANLPDAVAPHGQALMAAAGESVFARALAIAGRTWLRVLANQVDTEDVTAAARSLARFGLTWDATRLASQAALQTPDGRVSGAMLQLARDLKQTVADQDVRDDVDDAEPTARAGGGPNIPSTPTSSQLSDREREVAELLLLGMPYREIGTQLFISAKTVEHHVARIRRRLGAESRSEMLSMLRALPAAES